MLNSRIITIITFQRCSKKRTSGAEMHFIYLFEYISNSVLFKSMTNHAFGEYVSLL